MGLEAFGPEWAKAWGEKINASAAYRQAAGTWEWPLVLTMERDPSAGVSEDRSVYLDLWHGECREARAATPEDVESVPYVISADPYSWKQIFDREVEPLTAMMRGRLRLVKGNLSTLSAYVMAAKYLVESSLEVETDFPEGLQ
ncbi:SCP2 sterol-binding domain-containing protein [Kyrpidia spormannii]|uniref:SCP2 sterol-binding domain-containing protein n=1 Tax=Kyrpidia spormannii TaxID=2055160 RepID=UPI0018E480D1|nr:SCP2 sterol-binding domain-containing protein [Kyrpidia spormannii]